MKTDGSLTINIAFWFTMLSPLIGLIVGLLGAWFVSQSTPWNAEQRESVTQRTYDQHPPAQP
jgi:hypothetical protein